MGIDMEDISVSKSGEMFGVCGDDTADDFGKGRWGGGTVVSTVWGWAIVDDVKVMG